MSLLTKQVYVTVIQLAKDFDKNVVKRYACSDSPTTTLRRGFVFHVTCLLRESYLTRPLGSSPCDDEKCGLVVKANDVIMLYLW